MNGHNIWIQNDIALSFKPTYTYFNNKIAHSIIVVFEICVK